MDTVDAGRLSEAELRTLQAEGAAARLKFDETLQALQAAITSVDQVELLARLAFSLVVRVWELERAPNGKGIEVFHVEILQALALSQPRRSPGAQDNYPRVTQSLIELIKENGEAYQRLWKSKATNDKAENERNELISLLQSWTLAVRGMRHRHQTREYGAALATEVDPAFSSHFSCNASDVLAMLENAMDALQQRIDVYRDGVRHWIRKNSGFSMIGAFVRNLPADEAARIRAAAMPVRYNKKAVVTYLWNETERQFAAIFTFTFEELAPQTKPACRASLRSVLESLSMAFGDVTEEMMQHLHLSNPVRLKPFVKLSGERYFCCCPPGLGANLTEILEDLCATRPPLKERMERIRAVWLEAKLSNVVRRHLPHADVHSKIKWTDPDTQKGWESDVVALIDKTVLVFEAKSGKVSQPARRGAVNSLKRALKDLVVDPSDQSLRLQRYIEAATHEIHLRSAEGTFVIDPSKVRDVIRVNVLFDTIGPLSAHWPQMKAAGLIPEDADIAPSMSVFELETIFEVLSLEIERCHYLSRRAAFERHAKYTADEIDLLAFYLDTQFNVGNSEFDGSEFKLYGGSMRVAVRYTEKRDAGTLSFPIKRTKLWKRLLASLEANHPEGWTRFGYRLLNVDLEGQTAFERAVRGAWTTVLRSPGHFCTSGFTFGEGELKQTIAFVIGASESQEQFDHSLDYASRAAFEQGGTTDLLIIYWFIPETGQAYDFIGTMLTRELSGIANRITSALAVPC